MSAHAGTGGSIAKPSRARRPYLGYRHEDYATPFAEYFDSQMADLPRHVVRALEHGPKAAPLLLAFGDAGSLLGDGYHGVENGYTVLRDGSIHVSVLTVMPGVTPAMWDWWFGWHGSDPRRYKLWHPCAHLHAEWNDGDDRGRRGRERYVGRTSFVDEYLGATLVRGAIQFVPPARFGLDEGRLIDPSQATAICARIGSSDHPVDLGYLIHHVRATADGCEMRSRFWLGGDHVAARAGGSVASRVVRPIAKRMLGASSQSAAELLIHCAQEMNHLAGRLAGLYARFGDE